jgi:DNA invertase Pin-like site-specific DNA recombinase
MRLDIVPFYFLEISIKLRERFLMNAQKQEERQRQRRRTMYGWEAMKSHGKVNGTQFGGKKDDILTEGARVSLGRPLGSSRNRPIP